MADFLFCSGFLKTTNSASIGVIFGGLGIALRGAPEEIALLYN